MVQLPNGMAALRSEEDLGGQPPRTAGPSRELPPRVRANRGASGRRQAITTIEHESIGKAIRVYEQSETSLDAAQIAKEYCEFMTLKILSGDFGTADAKLSPGGSVDEFWHCHVLDTKGYP